MRFSFIHLEYADVHPYKAMLYEGLAIFYYTSYICAL